MIAYPLCLRNASSPIQRVFAIVCATQCVFAMHLCHGCVLRLPRHLRLPVRLHAMRLRNASAPIRPFLTNEPSQCGCVFRSFATLRQDAAMCVYIYIYLHTYIHTQTCASKCVEKDFGLLFCLRLHASATHFQYSFNIKKNSISQQPPTHMHM